jgi:predicted ATPase
VPVSTFLGRKVEAEQLRALVARCPLVTITGPAGIGKTRLAQETASAVSAQRGTDLVTVELGSLAAGAACEAVAAEIGFATPDAAAVRLGESSGLLLLDNCEHVLDAVALFVSRLLDADERVRVMTTSREPLGVPGEQLLVLEPLSLPRSELDVEASPAVQLFLDRASSAGARWDRSPATLAAIGELCRQLDGLPLAIELAAARSRALSPADLLLHLEKRLDLLHRPAARGGDDASDRHRSLRAAIDVSVDLLDGEERALFERLGVFAGPFLLGSVESITEPDGLDRLHTLDLLSRLVDRSLLVVDHVGEVTRYRLLEVLRARALEGLVRSGEEADIAERFVDGMAAEADRIVIEAMGQWSGDLLARISTQYHDLVAAIRWCVDRDPTPDRAFRLYLPLFQKVHQSHSREMLAVGVSIIGRWPEALAPWRAEALAVMSTAAVVAGETDAALRFGEAALQDPNRTIVAPVVGHRALGLAALGAGHLETARDHFRQGREEAGVAGAGSFGRELMGFEASVLERLGREGEALALVDDVVDRSVAADDRINEAWARLVRATMTMRAGAWDEARADIDLAHAASESLTQPWWEGAILRMQATVSIKDATITGVEGGWEASIESWRVAVEAAAAAGSIGELALTLRAAASVAAHLGRDDIAAALYAAAPTSPELGVLPEVFPDEIARLEAAHRGELRPAGIAAVVQRVRQVLSTAEPHEPHGPGASATVGEDSREPSAVTPTATASLKRHGDHWTARYHGDEATVRDLKGLGDLAVLIREPGVEVHCLQLMGAARVGGDAGPVIDDKARRAYQDRIRELQATIEEAQSQGNSEAAARDEAELDSLVAQLSAAFGLSGRNRATGSSTERARSAVTYRIRAAIRRVSEVHPELGRHLENSVRTGTWCTYQPETEIEWEVTT